MRSGAGLVAALALAGCAAWASPTSGSVLSGRISVRVVETVSDESARGLSATFELAGDAQRGSLSLSSSLGTRLGEASWAPGSVTLVRAGGTRTDYADLDAMTRELLGEALPLAALFDWLDGRPWSGAPSAPTRPPAAPGFDQLGWQVDLARFGDRVVVARRDGVTVRALLDAPSPR